MPEEHREAPDLESIFHPRGVAVVGASMKSGVGGNMFLDGFQAMGFSGDLYAVNLKAAEGSQIAGRPAYRTLADIPGPVDHVISSVPAPAVPGLVDEAAAKGARSIHLFTAGFRETGIGERAELEREVLRRARAGGIRLIGPNCMGLYCPESGLSFNTSFPLESGNVGVVAQSGGISRAIVGMGALRGLRFSRVVSFGNALDLDEADFYDYLAEQPDTAMVATYLEGAKDGPRTMRALRRLAARKPVVLLKGGETDAGSRAANSHTGVLAGSGRIWRAMARQTGVIMVDSVEDLCDQLSLLKAFPQGLTGARVAIAGSGGGVSVLEADACGRAGLDLPVLPDDIQERLREFTPVHGNSVRNPLDTFGIIDRENYVKTLRIASEADNIDVMILDTETDWGFRPQGRGDHLEATLGSIMEARRVVKKPIVIVVRDPLNPGAAQAWMDLQTRCVALGLPVFLGIEQAARALRRMVDWQQDRAR